MIKVTIKHDKRGWDYFRGAKGRVRVGGPITHSTRLWMQLGLFAIKIRRERLAKGLGSDDQPMKPLSGNRTGRLFLTKGGRTTSVGYAQYKVASGLSGIRDLYGPGNRPSGSGHMLDQLRVTYVSDEACKIDISQAAGRVKARANERRDPWIAWSPWEKQQIMAEYRRLFKQEVTDFSALYQALGLIAQGRGGSFLRRIAA